MGIPINNNQEQSSNLNNKNNIFFDNIDYQIISLILLGYDNSQTASHLKIPLSTIQRRKRKILQSGIIKLEYSLDYKMLGINKGLLHTYLNNGHMREIAESVSTMDGILATSIHVGNSDIVSEFVYENSEELVDRMAAIKQLDGVEHLVWSEEIVRLPIHLENIITSFKKYWKR